MKTMTLVSLVLSSCSVVAAAALPFESYYGKYEVIDCKKAASTNSPKDFCATKEVLIARAPTCAGAPHTSVFFASKDQQFNNTCTATANVTYAHKEAFAPGTGLNPEFYKYEKEEDGFDHYYIRTNSNGKSYIYTDLRLKKNPDQTVTSKFNRRETLIDSDSPMSSFEYEMTFKPK